MEILHDNRLPIDDKKKKYITFLTDIWGKKIKRDDHV